MLFGSLALLVTFSQAAAPAPVYAPPANAAGQLGPVAAPPSGQPSYGPPTTAPGPVYAPGYGAPPPGYGYPPGYGAPPPYGYPPQYGPQPDPDDRREWLEQRHGARYTGDKGKGKLVAGGLTLGFGALMGLSALTCMVTWAGLSDSGDSDARAMGAIAAGLGAAAVVAVGVGVPLVVVGKKRRSEYRAWLERQPIARARLGLGAGGLVLRF